MSRKPTSKRTTRRRNPLFMLSLYRVHSEGDIVGLLGEVNVTHCHSTLSLTLSLSF